MLFPDDGPRPDAVVAQLTELRFETVADFDAASLIYRRCRRGGVTSRGLVDCMIAAVALRHGAALLAHGVDLSRIAALVGIDMDEASTHP